MRAVLFSLFGLMLVGTKSGFAKTENTQTVSCQAEHFRVTAKGLETLEKKPLRMDFDTNGMVSLSVEFGGRAFVLSGDMKKGDFLITQALAPDYTSGLNATGAFNSLGRMQISQIQGNEVFKLECKRPVASEFPKE
jgi:hypothetical protein